MNELHSMILQFLDSSCRARRGRGGDHWRLTAEADAYPPYQRERPVNVIPWQPHYEHARPADRSLVAVANTRASRRQ
jgi:hypothetical protein